MASDLFRAVPRALALRVAAVVVIGYLIAALIVSSDVSTEASGELKDVGNFRAYDHEVSTTTQSLAVNVSRNIVDCLNESLIPLRNGTSKVWSR